MDDRQATGITGLDRLIGGIPRGSRNLLVGPPGSGKTTFAMQFHFAPYPQDPHVRYFELVDFEEMKAIDLALSKAGVSRLAAGDTLEHLFTAIDEEEWRKVEDWTINWCHHDRITNIDTMSEVEVRDAVTNRMKDYSVATAHNVVRFRVREIDQRLRRELRIEKMEGVAHPLDWMRFRIGPGGIEML